MSTQRPLYLELILREPAFEGQPTHTQESRGDRRLHVPVYYTWQEGPNDLHVFFHRDDDEDRIPFVPEFDEEGCGDYIVPDPDNEGQLVRAYHLGFIAESDKDSLVSDAYIERLKDLWSSPCDDRVERLPELVEFLEETLTASAR